MALTANRNLDHFIDQQLCAFAAANEHIFKGSLLSFESGGYVAPLTAAELFAGIAYKECDNSAGDDGDKDVTAFVQGDFSHTLSGAAITNIGAAIYASADNVLTLTSSGNTFVGYMIGLVEADTIAVRIAPFQTPP